jgi:hypothetical protein
MSPIFGRRGSQAAEEVHIGTVKLRCNVCGHDLFWQRRAQLNTAVATFLNFDWANRSATCFVCDRCGYVHWFLEQ